MQSIIPFVILSYIVFTYYYYLVDENPLFSLCVFLLGLFSDILIYELVNLN